MRFTSQFGDKASIGGCAIRAPLARI